MSEHSPGAVVGSGPTAVATSATTAALRPPRSRGDLAEPGLGQSGRSDRRHSGFRPDIEGLRAIAVLAVVVYHAGALVVGGGYVGVDIFFVISGFLITTNLYRELDTRGRISFAGFYGRRMIRLLPASALVVIATVAASWLWMSPLVTKAVAKDGIAAAVYGINVRLAMQGTDYLSATRAPSPLQHFWSLAVEEQFYLIWPLLLVVASGVWLRRRPSRRAAAITLAVLGAGSLVLCVWQTQRSAPWAYFGIQARAWELAAGALVALAAPRLARLPRVAAELATWAGLAAVLVAAFVYTDATVFPGYAAVLPVGGAALVIAGGCGPARGVPAVLGTAPLQMFGRLSYSWYLWHWPVLIVGQSIVGHALGVWLGLGLAFAALLPAWLSMRLLENPIRFRPSLRRRPWRGLVLGASLSTLSVGAAGFFGILPMHLSGSGHANDTTAVVADSPSSEAADRLSALIRTSARTSAMPVNLVPAVTAASGDVPSDTGCLASLDDTSTADAMAAGCDRYGDKDSSTTLVLFGDSHTEQWFDAVDAVAKQQHWRLVVLTKSGCTPADALTTKLNTQRAFTECASWRDDAMRVITSLKPAMVLMSTRTYGLPPVDRDNHTIAGDSDQLWTTALMDTATRIQRLGARLAIMQDTPDPGRGNVPECVAQYTKDVQTCSLPLSTALYAGRRAATEAAARTASIPLIDPVPWFCTDTVCPPIIGNALVYRDNSHVAASYIRLLTPLLSSRLIAALR
ncbi:acyltransferase family protein [Rugosimonospora africana]|uniref:Acyltransferase n=1 Tax=Rugosimonospora africana TaxID=556532 RepID=A0A8J3VUZ6_9ACTN|nr:acyltransferase family protein [Rugosimonospora africana]GIH19271.1 acyltransferase [Rugosimonospora africana]